MATAQLFLEAKLRIIMFVRISFHDSFVPTKQESSECLPATTKQTKHASEVIGIFNSPPGWSPIISFVV